MKILHLTDLHYTKKSKLLVERLKAPLIEKLHQINDEREIDLVLFTGDLVNAGSENNFDEANTEFIKPICDKLELEPEKFIICAGNHDMIKGEELDAIKDYIDKFNNNDLLDDFIKKGDKQFALSNDKCSNFNDFIKSYYSKSESFKFDNLYQIHRFETEFNKIGVVSFNSAWRSFVGNDSGQLLLPRISILEAHKEIEHCNVKICIMHHDLSEMRPYNAYLIEDLIYELFHLKFSGHYHKKRQEAYITPDIGMLSIYSPSSMSKDDGSKIGFSILEIDEETLEGEITNYDYSRNDNVFTRISSSPVNVPVNKEKKEQNELIKALKNTYEKELIEANDLLVYEDVDSIDKNFLELFSTPLLKTKSKVQTAEQKKDSTIIPYTELVSDNYIVYGKDKSGKTSLLRKIELDMLKEYRFNRIIPFYVDFKNLDLSSVSHFKLLKQFLGLSNSRINKIIKEDKFILLVDNFNPDKKRHADILNSFFDTLSVQSFVLTSEETLTSTLEEVELNKTYKKLYLHNLTRSEIRAHTKKWLGKETNSEQQEVIKKIETIFSQLNIPFNYWALSLFLWLYKKEKNINIHDNIELVNLYIDGLLERKQLAISGGNIDYDTFRSFLGELAHHLLTNYQDYDYSIPYDKLVGFIDKCKGNNIRFVADTEELLDFLIGRGVLKKRQSTSKYSFRLNGVLEFFLAVHMKENKKFVDDVLSDDLFFLEFANELEIYAGFIKNDVQFLNKIRDRVEKALEPVNRQYQDIDPDEILVSKIKNVSSIASLTSAINPENQVPIEYSEQDNMMDDIKPLDCFDEEVKVKKPLKSIDSYSHTELEKHLFILCRVFRGLSLIKDKEVVDKTLDFILDSIINLGFNLLEEISLESDKDTQEKEKFLIDLLSSFIPLIVQMNLSEALLQKNLKRLILDKIDELKADNKNNEYKLYILYYMLLDISLDEYSYLIDEIVSTFKLFPLKNTSLFKLYYLLLFKANGNKHNQNLLKDGIVKQQLTINNKLDKSQIKQQIDKQININNHIN